MKKHISRIIAAALTMGLGLTAWGGDETDQSEFPQITAQPTDQDVLLGGSTVLTVESTGDSYQWLRNGVAIAGQTNSTLKLENVGTDDVGYYSCYIVKGAEVVPTRAAAVTAYAMGGGGSITIFGLPVVGGGSSGSCPGSYAGYVNYSKTISQGWGWAPTSGTTVHTATDTNRTDTAITYLGRYSDNGCGLTSVTVPHPTISLKYRFTVFFPNNVPTNSYALTLDGFDP